MYVKRTTLFLFGMALLLALIYSLDFDKFYQVASRLGTGWFLLILSIQTLMLFLMALRWHVIIRRYGARFKNVLHTSLIGYMINNLTPMSLAGGEPVRAYIISKLDDIKTEKAFATVLVELFIALLPALIINFIAIYLVFDLSQDPLIAAILALLGVLMFLAFAVATAVLLRRKHSLSLLNIILKYLKRISYFKTRILPVQSRIENAMSSFNRGINATLADSSCMTWGLIVSVFVWVLNYLKVYLIFMGLGIDIDFETVVIVYAILNAVSIFPLIPGAMGLWEWLGVYLFMYFGIPREEAAAAILIDRMFFYWLPIGLGSLAALRLGIDAHSIMKKQQASQSRIKPE